MSGVKRQGSFDDNRLSLEDGVGGARQLICLVDENQKSAE